MQTIPSELVVLWELKQPSPLRWFVVKIDTQDRSPITPDPALIDRLVGAAALINAAVSNLPG